MTKLNVTSAEEVGGGKLESDGLALEQFASAEEIG